MRNNSYPTRRSPRRKQERREERSPPHLNQASPTQRSKGGRCMRLLVSHPLRSPIALIAAVMLVGCERWALDRQMGELCKKDGGIKVYETVKLPATDFNNLGQPLAQYATKAGPIEDQLGPEYRFIERREVVAGRKNADPTHGEGRVLRIHQSVVRRSDSSLLGEAVWYERGGGDGFTFGFQPSSDYCPKPRVQIANAIFMKGE